jgi:hypothetical protein
MAVESAEDLASFFDPEEFGSSATFTPDGGSPVSLTVVHSRSSDAVALGAAQIMADIHFVRIRVADVTLPASGDQIEIAGVSYRLNAAPELDAQGVVWTCSIEPVA